MNVQDIARLLGAGGSKVERGTVVSQEGGNLIVAFRGRNKVLRVDDANKYKPGDRVSAQGSVLLGRAGRRTPAKGKIFQV